MSDIVLRSDNTNLNNTHAAVEKRLRKMNKSALEPRYSDHRNSLAWGTSSGFFFFKPSSDSPLQPEMRATSVHEGTLDDILHLVIKLLSAWGLVDFREII